MPQLILSGNAQQVVQLEAVSPHYEAQWEDAIAVLVRMALVGRAVVFVLPDPPTWDITPSDLASRLEKINWGVHKFILAWVEAATPAVLQAAVESTDFRLQALWLLAHPPVPATSLGPFLDLLLQPNLTEPSGPEEFIECVNDGETLVWHRPEASALQRVINALTAWGQPRGWGLDLLLQ